MEKCLSGFSVFMFLILTIAPGALAETCTEYLDPPGNSYSMASGNGFVYICLHDGTQDSRSMLQCYDLGSSISTIPSFRSRIFLPTTSSGIVLMDEYAILAMGSLGLGLVDISNPDLMPEVSLTATGDGCRNLALLGADHVVTAEWSAVRIYDLRNPTAPVAISGVAVTQARTVAVSGDLVLVACGNLGLAIVDISNPSAPTLVKQVPVGGFVMMSRPKGTVST